MAQRDAQYTETKQLAKEEILMAFGVPESVIGNAADRTFSNADTELEVFWRETMLPHLMLIERAFDRLDGSDELTVKFNLEDVAILSRDERERASYHLEELKFGAISIDEYREKTGREPVGADLMWIQANLMPIGQAVADGQTPSTEFTPPELPEGQPGVVQPHAPMVVPEVEPSEVVPEAASLNGAVEEKSEGKESAPLEPDVWGFQFGDTWIDHKAADEIRARRAQQTERLIASISIQMAAFFKRQQRVLLEKWNSAKIREKINKGVSVGVNDIMDVPVWDRQLLADAKTFIMATVIDGGNEFALMTSKQIEPDEELVAVAVVAGLERMTEVNRTTRRQIEKKITEGLAAGKSAADIGEEIKAIFDDAVKNRARLVANNVVTFGLNEGQMIEASKTGLRYKVWLSQQDAKVRATHTHADGQARPLFDPFVVGGHLMMHPGSLTAPIEEVANCRCTMLFTNEPTPAGLLEFGVNPEEMASLRDSGVIARLVNSEVAASSV